MANQIINEVLLTDTFDEWRTKNNEIINTINVMDLNEDNLTVKESPTPDNPESGYNTLWVDFSSGSPELKLLSNVNGTLKTYSVTLTEI